MFRTYIGVRPLFQSLHGYKVHALIGFDSWNLSSHDHIQAHRIARIDEHGIAEPEYYLRISILFVFSKVSALSR